MFHIQYLRYLKEDFETRLAAVANIRVYYAETLAKPFCKPSLFDAALFAPPFYAILGLSSLFNTVQSYKILCNLKRKENLIIRWQSVIAIKMPCYIGSGGVRAYTP